MSEVPTGTIETRIPGGWTGCPGRGWHWPVVVGLGTVWILDGLQVTLPDRPVRPIAHTAFKSYPKRTVLGLALFVGQAFLYNAVFFTQALVLSTSGGADDVVPAYISGPC